MKFVWGREACCLAAVVTLALSGCGGGGGSSDNGSNAMVVDPYIKGAKFNEIEKGTKKVLQTSEASKEDGKFKFSKTLTVGNTLEMKDDEKGEHGKVPFEGKLKYKVTKKSKRAVEEDIIIITPLTTLISDQIDELVLDGTYLDADAAEDAATEDVVEFVKTVTGVTTFTAADLAVDPMARVNDGNVTAADAALLAANMAANTTLQVLGGTTGTIDLTDATVQATASAVATELATVFTANASNVTAATEAAVAVTTYISENKISDAATISLVADQADAIVTTLTDPSTTPEQIVVITGTPGVDLGTATYESSNFVAQTYYDEGQAAFKVATTTDAVADYKLAASKFLAAAALKDTITDTTLKDKVLFFGAFATVMQLADPISDNTANGLNNFGDLIDAFGFSGSLAQTTDRSHLSEISLETCTTQGTPPYTWIDCDLSLSTSSPTSDALQAFAGDKVGAELQKAITMLGAVSGSFSESVEDAGGIVEFDATDAKFISAVANSMLAQINFLQAYNLGNVDIDYETSPTTNRTPDGFLAAYPNLGKLKDASKMAAFKTSIDNAIAGLESTVTALQAEGDAQDDDFIKLSNTDCVWNGLSFDCTTTYNDAAEIAAFEADLAEVKTVLASTATTPYPIWEDTDDDGIDDAIVATINLAPFFQGVNLRSKLPSTFTAGPFGDGIGPLPDWSFGGILHQIDLGDGLATPSTPLLNVDLDKDGSPDFFEMSYFVPGMLKDRTFYTWIQNPGTGSWDEWVFSFDPTTNDFDCTLNGTPVSSGTYTTDKNILTLNFTSPVGPNSVTRLVSALDSRYNDGTTDFDFKTTAYNNTINLGTVYHYMWGY